MKRPSMEELRRRAIELRRNMTPAERALWAVLRASTIRFGSQRILYPFIVDFCAPDVRVVVEVDGGVHLERAAYDARRDHYLASRYGMSVLRFANDDVIGDGVRVFERIEHVCRVCARLR